MWQKRYPPLVNHALLILLLSVPFIGPLLNPHWIMVGESTDQILRVIELNRGIHEGELYPRWFGDLAGGFGNPYFVFYAPLIYYVSAAFHFLGFGILSSLKLMIFLGVVLSGIGMFLLARTFWGNYGGLVSAVAFIYVPYRMVNIYIRGDFAEAFAMALFPFVLYFFYQLLDQKTWHYWVGAVTSYAALILTHNCSALIFSGFLVLFIGFFSLRERKLRKSLRGLGGVAWAITLSAVFWLPALLEKKWVNIHRIYSDPALDFHNNFLQLDKLLSPAWNLEGGIGGRDLPFQIGWPHLLLAFFSFVYIMQLNSEKSVVRQNTQFFLLCVLLALFFIHPSSELMWEKLPLLKYLQFPWRYLTVLATFVSLLCGGLFVYFSAASKMNQKAFLTVLLIVIVLATIQYCHVKGYYVMNEEILTPAFVKKDGGTVSACNKSGMDTIEDYGEYMPRSVTRLPSKEVAGKVFSPSGKTKIMNLKLFLDRYEFTASAEDNEEVIVGSFYYPGWEARVQGKPISLFTDEEGLIHLRIPRGNNQVVVAFEDTWERKLARAISLVGVLGFVPILFMDRKKRFGFAFKRGLVKENAGDSDKTLSTL